MEQYRQSVRGAHLGTATGAHFPVRSNPRASHGSSKRLKPPAVRRCCGLESPRSGPVGVSRSSLADKGQKDHRRRRTGARGWSPVQKAQEEICSLLVRQIISSEPYESQQAQKRLTPRADRQHGRGSRGFSLRSAPRVFCHARLARPSRIACCWVAARSRIPV